MAYQYLHYRLPEDLTHYTLSFIATERFEYEFLYEKVLTEFHNIIMRTKIDTILRHTVSESIYNGLSPIIDQFFHHELCDVFHYFNRYYIVTVEYNP
jgi:hypothetical protein